MRRRRLALALLGLLLLPAAPVHALHAAQAPVVMVEEGAPAPVWGCPMCETVRKPAAGTCPRCGMALVPMDAHGPLRAEPLMPGLPPWVVGSVAVGILLLSFALVAVRDPPGPRPPGRRLDVLGLPGLRRVLTATAFPAVAQLPVVLLFLLVIATGLAGNQVPERNLAPVLTWTVWWAGLVLVVLVFGKLWCTVCPWMALADWAGRLLPRLDRPWPRALRNLWPATTLFVALTWLELGYGVTGKPWLTAALGLLMVAMALGSVVVFERRGFCRYACLVGRVSGLYATFAASELRAADPAVCRGCATKDCLHGNARGPGCPTFQYLGAMRENTYCTLCLACVKTCPRDNVAWNARPPGADLLESVRPRRDEAWLAVVMLAMSAFHGLTMTPGWERLVAWLDVATGVGRLAAFSAAMAVMLVLPAAAYAGVCVAMRWCAGDPRHDVRTLFVRFAYPLLPIALFYHLAHNAQHVLFEVTKLGRVASDPFGWGWDVFGTARMPVGALLPVEAGWALQVGLIVVGHVYAIVVAHRTARALYPDARVAALSQIPMLAAMLLFSFQSLWLLGQPMVMRTAM